MSSDVVFNISSVLDLNETFAPTPSPPSTATPSMSAIPEGSVKVVQDTQTLIIAILIGTVAFLLTILIALVAPRMSGGRRRPTYSSGDDGVDPRRIKHRHETIKQWLIVQTVASKDESAQKEVDEATTARNQQSPPDCCHICMEPFLLQNTVAWSCQCDHVYHVNCIREWLLKSTDCPVCRRPALATDAENEWTPESLQQAWQEKEARHSNTCFYVDEGLVNRTSSEVETSPPPPKQWWTEPPITATVPPIQLNF